MAECSQPGCRFAETGVCLEGHATGCPHLRSEATGGTAGTTTTEGGNAALRQFHSGEKLSIEEASAILHDRSAHVVCCAGAQASGKTTFLARIGEQFRLGPVGQLLFAGSLTLCGFERVSWLATVAGAVGRPDTPRTRRAENDRFLHLAVREGDSPICRDLLITDLAGETFPVAVGSEEFCGSLRGLLRSDVIVLFLDCERLVNANARHAEQDNALGFLRRVLQVKRQPQETRVQVVFSRWDYVTSSEDSAKHTGYCESLEARFRELYKESFAELTFWRIAARPANGRATGDLIPVLFADWLKLPVQKESPVVARGLAPARDFCSFGVQ